MEKVRFRAVCRRVFALIVSLALMISGMSATAGVDHDHSAFAAPAPAQTALDADAMGHGAHRMTSDATVPECCEPETSTSHSCHVSSCCLWELQGSEIQLISDRENSACVGSLTPTPVRSAVTWLPERPPRIS